METHVISRSLQTTFFLLGMAQLATWNVFSRVVTFVNELGAQMGREPFSSHAASAIISTAYTSGVLIMQVILLIFPVDELMFSTRLRIVGSIFLQMTLLLSSMIICVPAVFQILEKNFLKLLPFFPYLSGTINAVMIRGFLLLVSRSDPRLSISFGLGQTFCGLVYSLASIITLMVYRLFASTKCFSFYTIALFYSFGVVILLAALASLSCSLIKSKNLESWISDVPTDNGQKNLANSSTKKIDDEYLACEAAVLESDKSKTTESSRSQNITGLRGMCIILKNSWTKALEVLVTMATTMSIMMFFMSSPRIPISSPEKNFKDGLLDRCYHSMVYLVYFVSECLGRATVSKTKVERWGENEHRGRIFFDKLIRLIVIARILILVPMFMIFSPVFLVVEGLSWMPLCYMDMIYLLSIACLGYTNGWCLQMNYLHVRASCMLLVNKQYSGRGLGVHLLSPVEKNNSIGLCDCKLRNSMFHEEGIMKGCLCSVTDCKICLRSHEKYNHTVLSEYAIKCERKSFDDEFRLEIEKETECKSDLVTLNFDEQKVSENDCHSGDVYDSVNLVELDSHTGGIVRSESFKLPSKVQVTAGTSICMDQILKDRGSTRSQFDINVGPVKCIEEMPSNSDLLNSFKSDGGLIKTKDSRYIEEDELEELIMKRAGQRACSTIYGLASATGSVLGASSTFAWIYYYQT